MEEKLFEKCLEETIKIVANESLNEEYRYNAVEEFCSIFKNYDSSKFDKYFE